MSSSWGFAQTGWGGGKPKAKETPPAPDFSGFLCDFMKEVKDKTKVNPRGVVTDWFLKVTGPKTVESHPPFGYQLDCPIVGQKGWPGFCFVWFSHGVERPPGCSGVGGPDPPSVSQAAQIWNHTFYWNGLRPAQASPPGHPDTGPARPLEWMNSAAAEGGAAPLRP